jgi:hypothetical protein
LRGHDKCEELLRIHRELAVIRGIVSRKPSAAALGGRALGRKPRRAGGQAVRARHVAHDQGFQAFFRGVGLHLSSKHVRLLEIMP